MKKLVAIVTIIGLLAGCQSASEFLPSVALPVDWVRSNIAYMVMHGKEDICQNMTVDDPDERGLYFLTHSQSCVVGLIVTRPGLLSVYNLGNKTVQYRVGDYASFISPNGAALQITNVPESPLEIYTTEEVTWVFITSLEPTQARLHICEVFGEWCESTLVPPVSTRG